MYQRKYYRDQKITNDVTRTFSDEEVRDFESNFLILDDFLYLIDMYRIMKENKEAFVSFQPQHGTDFPELNRRLLNYVNAVYSYREYLLSYDPPLGKIVDDYHRKNGWYRYIIDYRNIVIHQSVLIKAFGNKSGKPIVQIEADIDTMRRLIERKEKRLGDPEYQRWTNSIQKDIGTAKDYIKLLSRLPEKIQTTVRSDIRNNRTVHCVDMDQIIELAQKEIDSLHHEAIQKLLPQIIPTIEWLLSLIYQVDDTYMDTFIVNEEIRDVFSPNEALEYHFIQFRTRLDPDDIINKFFYRQLKDHHYEYLYSRKISLDEFCSK